MGHERERAPDQAAPRGAQNEEQRAQEPVDEWVDEAQDEEWVEEDAPAAPTDGVGKRRPKETPPWVNWVAGLAGLLVGLLFFRSCG